MDDPGLQLDSEGVDKGVDQQQQLLVMAGEPEVAPLFRLTRDLLYHQVLPFCARVDVAALMAVGRVESEYGLNKLFCEIHGTRFDSLTANAGGNGSACMDCRMFVLNKERCTGCDDFFHLGPFAQVSLGTCGQTKCRACGPIKHCSDCGKRRHDNCADCGAVGTCYACRQTFCEGCGDLVACDGCKKLFKCNNDDCGCSAMTGCKICDKEYCHQCSDKYGFCDMCLIWYCKDCAIFFMCDPCNLSVCSNCGPGIVEICSKCGKCSIDCRCNVFTCEDCKLGFCESCRDVRICESCNACYCADCQSLDECNDCGDPKCSSCIVKNPRAQEPCPVCNGCMCFHGTCESCGSENFCAQCDHDGKHTCGSFAESDECHERKQAKTQHSSED